jgi:aerobic-type carbon monoxide dehydrogenase small subunit (CoxS/CutS family)
MDERPRGPDGKEARRGISRRSLIKTAGVAAAAGALHRAGDALAQEQAEQIPGVGPDAVPVTLEVNGEKRKVTVEPRRTLLDALRTDLDLTGAKRACDRGSCGACTVWLDDEPVYACSILAVEAEGRSVTTVESLGAPDALHPVQEAFRKHDALQCGFCTPGLVMSCAWAVRKHGAGLTREQVLEATSGNLCRCGTYEHVVSACLAAAQDGGK